MRHLLLFSLFLAVCPLGNKAKAQTDEHYFVNDENFNRQTKLAKQGDAKAQYNLGMIYYEGEEVSKNDKKAIYWFKKSALQGDANAQYNLGVMYYKGKGLKKDFTQAVYWFKKSALQGDAEAQYNLGVMYDQGQGLKKDFTQAVYWYKKSALQGRAEAQRIISNLNERNLIY